MRVAIIGTGYVGLTTCVAMAYLTHEVVGVDVDPQKLKSLLVEKVPSTNQESRYF
jgi:UDPglucose 6-dehydrogenase